MAKQVVVVPQVPASLQGEVRKWCLTLRFLFFVLDKRCIMEIIFREMPHTYDEVVMGQKLWFLGSIESDAISATANSYGFTPLTAIARRYGWDCDSVERASRECNRNGEVAIINDVKPRLLLVPKTKGKSEVAFLIDDLIAAANAINVDVLSFTHYGFVQNKLPKEEVNSILKVMMSPQTKSTIRVVVFDIDFRFKKEMITLWQKMRGSTSF